MNILPFVFGLLFGVKLQYSKLNRFNIISSLVKLENLTVVKAITVAFGVGITLINIEIGLGLTSYHIKPFILG